VKIGDIIELDPHWRTGTNCLPLWANDMYKKRGVILGFVPNPDRVVIHFFDDPDSRKYRYYSSRHLRPIGKIPNYKGFVRENR
jgi:hypothetical protein